MFMIEICDPRSGPSTATHSAGGIQSLSGKVVGFIDNTKPNFNYLVDDLAEILVEKYGAKNVLKRGKRVQSIPAPQAVYAELQAEADIVISGSGD